MTLTEGIRESMNLFGAEIIRTERLINVLSDLGAFEIKASRTILRALIINGHTEQMYCKYIRMDDDNALYIKSVIEKVASLGYNEAISSYVVGCMSKALGWIDKAPEYSVSEAENHTVTRTFTVHGVSFTICEVKGGAFSMGATPEQGLYANFDERPAVNVEVDTFAIGQTLVTQQLWCAVMDENPSHFRGDTLPVERVTWHECVEFIERLSNMTGHQFRLPTEAEWEYAARGGNLSAMTKYAGADDDIAGDYMWYNDNSAGTTHQVSTKAPNELGIYDMSGNVSEWCHDWYFNSYANNTTNVNPAGPRSGIAKVLRGGSYNDKAINCRTSRRMAMNPDYRSRQAGFRIATDNLYGK